MPKVSVIIPVYNVEKYLRECLDSVINQTLSDIEIICINDGSTDNSLEILREYAQKDERIILISRENKGVSVSRNEGIKKATGEYIAFIDADDYLENNNYYEQLYECAAKSNSDIAKGSYRYGKRKINNGVNEKIKEDKNNFIAQFASAIYSSKMLKDNNISFPTIMDMEDTVFVFACAIHANTVKIVPNAIYSVVLNPNSVTRSKLSHKQVLDKLTGLQKIIEIANNSNISLASFAYIIGFWFVIIYNDILKSTNYYTKFVSLCKLKRIYYGLKGVTSISDYIIANRCNIFLQKLVFNIFQDIFSIKNIISENNKFKVLSICGIKIKIKKEV